MASGLREYSAVGQFYALRSGSSNNEQCLLGMLCKENSIIFT